MVTSLSFSACETPGEGAKHGAMIGAGIGALAEGSLEGAIKGAAIGAASGALLGHLNREERRSYRYDRYDDYDDADYGRYPVAEPTRYRGFVRSPYRPYNVIDVRGIPRGAVVEDPSTGGRFINP